MAKETLKIKRRSEDGHRIISVRIREDILAELDRLASETNRSRNELINMILEHGLQNIEIE
jgi:metal-responsive CopG/Arc/MetJ family transcriptional regulator